MKEKHILICLFLVFLPLCWLTVPLLHCEPLHAVELNQVSLQIEGMTWGACPVTVRAALEGLKGVKNAQVSFAPKSALVTYDPRAVGVEAMIQAVKRAGFSAHRSPAN